MANIYSTHVFNEPLVSYSYMEVQKTKQKVLKIVFKN